VCWSIDIIYEFLIWCDFVYTLCVVCLPLWYTNNMYTLLLSSVLLTQCPSPLIPFHYRFAFRSLIIDSFIQSVVCGEGVILFIRYMFCSYGLYHESACYLTIVIPKVVEGEMEMGRGGMDAVILPLFVGYWWCTQTVYPVASLFSFFFWPPIQSSIEVYWGFYRYKILYISVLFFLVTYVLWHGNMSEKERAYFYRFFFDFFNWLMVGSVAWLHVVSVHPIIWSVCSFFFALLSRGAVSVCYCSFILLLIFSLSFILLLLMYLTDGEWNAVCLSECPSLFFHFISFFQCKAPNTVWFVYSFWKRLRGFSERTTSTIPLLIGTWFNESIQFVVFDVIPCR